MFYLSIVSVLFFPYVWSFSCFDDNRNPVDWFVAIKLPTTEKATSQNYFLFTSDLKAWRPSHYEIGSKVGAIYYTVSQAYNVKNKNKTLTVMYNDENPENLDRLTAYTYGHLKGILAFEADTQGFWMIDSVPKFPDPLSYSFPDSGLRYAQHFICVTFGFDSVSVIAKQLAYARPETYGSNLPNWMASKFPDLALLVHHKRPKVAGVSNMAKLQSVQGQIFVHFSKSAAFGEDLYESLVAERLQASLYMEGWVNQKDVLPSACDGQYHVYNINQIQLQNFSWPTTKDHSKWAVSADKTKRWVCLGDINRVEAQFRRGGGTLCLADDRLWSAFSAMVAGYDHCQTMELSNGYQFNQL